MAPLLAALASGGAAVGTTLGSAGSAIETAVKGAVATKGGVLSKLGGALEAGSGSPLGKLTQGPAAQTGAQSFGSTLKGIGGVIDKLPKRPQNQPDNTLSGTGPGSSIGSIPQGGDLLSVIGSVLSEKEEQPSGVGQLQPGFSKLDQGGF